jgi:glutathione S-transferase
MATKGKPTLTYFNIRARAEPARLAFTIGGVDFEDERIGREEHSARKQDGREPLGQLPTLSIEDDDLTYCQSGAILRYAGRRTGLYPSDAKEALKVDMVRSVSNEKSHEHPIIISAPSSMLV